MGSLPAPQDGGDLEPIRVGRTGGAQDEVKAIYKRAEESNIEFNLYIKGEEGDEEAAVEERLEPAAAPGAEEASNG